MEWVLAAAVTWLLVAVLLGVLIGRSVDIADAQESLEAELDEPNFVTDLLPLDDAPWRDQPAPPAPDAAVRDTAVRDAEVPLHPPTSRDRSTIPGLSVARPSAARPPVPGRRVDPPDPTIEIRSQNG